jgi:Lon protease-like protein
LEPGRQPVKSTIFRVSLLPLFPLQVVLFPGTALPLHIFEPRYKEMIGECLERKQPFGVVLAQENSLVGCTAEIIKVVQRYDDGRLDIFTEGRQRFEILNLDRERPFLRGEVLPFDDEGEAVSREEASRAVELQQQLLALAGEHGGLPEADHPQLSFQLAAGVPLELDFKQNLLGMRSEKERMAILIRYYQELIPKLQRALKARNRAGGNGHRV